MAPGNEVATSGICEAAMANGHSKVSLSLPIPLYFGLAAELSSRAALSTVHEVTRARVTI